MRRARGKGRPARRRAQQSFPKKAIFKIFRVNKFLNLWEHIHKKQTTNPLRALIHFHRIEMPGIVRLNSQNRNNVFVGYFLLLVPMAALGREVEYEDGDIHVREAAVVQECGDREEAVELGLWLGRGRGAGTGISAEDNGEEFRQIWKIKNKK